MNDFEANCGPRSEIILSGSPNLLYKLSSKSFAVPSACDHFVAWDEDHPLTKALVYHDQDRNKDVYAGQISDKVH